MMSACSVGHTPNCALIRERRIMADMGQLVSLVQGSNDSIPKPHLSQVCLSGSLSGGGKRHDNVWMHVYIMTMGS